MLSELSKLILLCQLISVPQETKITEPIDTLPQLNPFAMATREAAREKQTEVL